MNEWSFFCAKWLNPWWQSSRWLPSSSWVRMIWVKVFLCQMAESKMAEFKMAAIIKLSQNELVKSDFCGGIKSGVRVFWVNLRKDNKMSESKMADLPRWQSSRWLPSSSWVRMNEWSFFCAKWLNPRWQNSRWLPSSSWVRMNEFESYWISLSQSQSGVRVFLSDRKDNKMSAIQDGSVWIQHESFKMAAIIKLSQNEWVSFFVQNGWIQDGRIQDGCHHQVESEWMSLSHIELVWVRVRSGVRVFLSESEKR